jgi:transglutaminase-like putative cysteine protease
MKEFLHSSDIIDWRVPEVFRLAKSLAGRSVAPETTAKACFEWVRDEIRHSVDYKMNPVTWRASDVLEHKTGYCYAKSHLLAALLRANGIPAGFCYQRLSVSGNGEPYSLHGFNAVYLPDVGWYRIDPRGNREGVDAQFAPPEERLAFKVRLPGEAEFRNILPEPLETVVQALLAHDDWESMLHHLPDVPLESASQYGLIPKKE